MLVEFARSDNVKSSTIEVYYATEGSLVMPRLNRLPLTPIEKDILDTHKEILRMKREVQECRRRIHTLRSSIREREELLGKLRQTMNDPMYNPLRDSGSDPCV